MVIADGDGETTQLTSKGLTSRGNDPTVIASVISDLRELERRSGIERTLAIGELILQRFFCGDPTVWRDRRRSKSSSIRRLASRPDCPFCRSALNEAVAVYIATLELPCVRTFGHVGASHVASVLKLDQPQRALMLDRAERERLSVRELRQHVVALRRADGERRGRPSLNGGRRALALLRHGVNSISDGLGILREGADLAAPLQAELAGVAAEMTNLSAAILALKRPRPDVARAPRESTLRLRKRSA